jgi:hypothetical protein
MLDEPVGEPSVDGAQRRAPALRRKRVLLVLGQMVVSPLRRHPVNQTAGVEQPGPRAELVERHRVRGSLASRDERPTVAEQKVERVVQRGVSPGGGSGIGCIALPRAEDFERGIGIGATGALFDLLSSAASIRIGLPVPTVDDAPAPVEVPGELLPARRDHDDPRSLLA